MTTQKDGLEAATSNPKPKARYFPLCNHILSHPLTCVNSECATFGLVQWPGRICGLLLAAASHSLPGHFPTGE